MQQTRVVAFPSLIVSIGVAVASAWLYFARSSLPIPAGAAASAALLLFTLGFFALAIVPESFTALLFFVVGTMAGIAPPAVLFSGFTTGAFWLVFAGLILGEAMKKTGLADTLARAMLARAPGSYTTLIGLVALLSGLLCFIMPSTPARILLLLPLLMAMAAQLGLAPGSRGYIGVCLTCILTSYYVGATILTANAPNLVLAGAAENLHNVSISYTRYLWALFPVLGVVKALVIWLLMAKLFSTPLQRRASEESPPAHTLDMPQRRLAILLALTLLTWLTDGLHHIHPGWIALTAVALCLLPVIGVLPPSALNNPVNIAPLLYLAAALGIGSLINHSGLVDVFAQHVDAFLALSASAGYSHYFNVALFTTLAGLFTTNPGLPALTAPLAVPFAGQSGWSVETALMLTAVGYTTLLAPYQAPPIVIGLHVSGIAARRALGITAAIALLSVAVLWPLNYLWWHLIVPARLEASYRQAPQAVCSKSPALA